MTKLLSRAMPSMRAQMIRATTYHHDLRLRKPVQTVLAFLAISLLLGAFSIIATLYTTSYAVTVEGEAVGAVASVEMLEQSIAQVEEEVSVILGEAYAFHPNIEGKLTLHRKDDILTHSRLSEALYASIAEVKPGYVLTMDGEAVGVASDQSVLNQVLAQVEDTYVTHDTNQVFFANETSIAKEYIPSVEAFATQDFFVEHLQEGVVTEIVYEVRQGDTLRSIASEFSMSRAELMAFNEGLRNDTDLYKGQLLKVESIVPRLSVCTVDRVSYTKEIPSPIRNVDDPDMYEGDTRVMEQGSAGREFVVADRTYFNGDVLTEDVLKSKVMIESVETVMAVGTKERPPEYGTGVMQWPTRGTVHSEFGYRHIFGSTSFHSGIDIAGRRGTAIASADRGRVVYTGYKGSYGNLVIVGHGDGLTTYYAHCESILVAEGDYVEKGQQVATMGSTGRTTGVHLHFEVNQNREKLNPRNFLP